MSRINKLYEHTGRNDAIITDKFLKDHNYQVLSDGTIWTRISTNGCGLQFDWRRAEHVDYNGYLAVNYRIAPRERGKPARRATKRLRAHRIVYAKFKGPLACDKVVNHMNGVKTCNEPDNLELITYEANNTHAFEVLGHSPIKNAKLSFDIADEIRELKKQGVTHRVLCEKYDISKGHVSMIVNDLIWIRPKIPPNRNADTSAAQT